MYHEKSNRLIPLTEISSDGLMSNCGLEQRGGYKLIPQLNSDDTDLSEEELQSLNRDGFQIITKKLLNPSVTFRTSSINPKPPGFKNKMNAENNRPDVLISCQKARVSNELVLMSVERKLLFGLSIVLCFVVVALFLSIPCSWSDCSHNLIKSSSHEIWTKMLPNIELVGPITPVLSVDKHIYNFVFMARGCIFADAPVIRTNFSSSFGGDVLCLKGINGEQMWGKHFNKMPSDLDCSIFSIKDEAQKDCLIISYSNFVAVLSSATGQVPWITTITPRNNKTKQCFPILLPKSVYNNSTDLLVAKDVKTLLVISGRRGKINRTIELNCSDIQNLRLSDQHDVQLHCLKNNSLSNLTISLDRKPNANTTDKILQHEPFEKSNRLFVRNLTISVANEGAICPRTCKSVVQIKNLEEKIVWSHEFLFAYVMTPQSFDLTNVLGIYGFVFKIWEHKHEDKKLKKPKIWQNSKKLMANLIYERTVMVLFNTSHHEFAQTANVSFHQIRQIYDAQKSVQPDPVSQRHSLFVSDIWNNGSYQLVSYYSTIEDERKNNYSFTDYMLKSYVSLYDLRKEVHRSMNFSIDEL